MRSLIRRRSLIAGMTCAAVSVLGVGSVVAAPKKTYKYKCMKCKLIQEYGTPGSKKCPNDGQTMVRQF